MGSVLRSLTLGIFALVLSGFPIVSAPLGVAADWNAFVFDTLQYTNATAGGGFAAGTSVSITNVTVAEAFPANNTSLQLLSAGSLQAVNGFVRGSIQFATTGSSSAGQPPGATLLQGPSPFDFAVQRAIYEFASDDYAALASNGTVTEAFGTLTLQGANSGLNVFSVNALAIGNSINNIVLEIPVGATALINVAGTGVSFGNLGLNTSFGSTPGSKILWNLPGAANAAFSSVHLQGAVLAPRALVDLQNGSLSGQIVANRLTGSSFGLGYQRFDGDIPAIGPTPVPEPATLGLTALCLGGILLFGIGRRV